MTATATDPSGNTSEFSQEFGTDIPPTAVIGFTTLTVNEGRRSPSTAPGLDRPRRRSAHLLLVVRRRRHGDRAEPIHTYRQPGTFTVTLTVNDGFGGTNTAQATMIVNNVPPSSCPARTTPPLTFATPSPGDGFGEAVASVNEARRDRGPVRQRPRRRARRRGLSLRRQPRRHGGPRSASTLTATLIHVFADPNPAPGDQFGASLAAVGNDLLVGAPGSSLTGPGDGVAYVFDANPESTTFGDLLATLTIPDPDARPRSAVRRRGLPRPARTS